MTKKLLSLVYLIILAIPIISWWQNLDGEGGWYPYLRLTGLVSFTLMVLQLGVGAFMLKLRPIFGASLVRVHIVQGILATVLAFVHPLLFVARFGWETFVRVGGYVNWGKVGLVILVLTVAAGALRTAPFLMRHWRWIHRLNYVLLAVVYVHSWNLGSDVRTFPMVVIYWLTPVLLVAGIYYKFRPIPQVVPDSV